MHDIDRALRVFDAATTTNRYYAAIVLANLADWADADHSDGWAYWPKPRRSASKLMELIEGDGTRADQERLRDVDATDAELRKALVPVKSFLTRQGVSADDRESILPSHILERIE